MTMIIIIIMTIIIIVVIRFIITIINVMSIVSDSVLLVAEAFRDYRDLLYYYRDGDIIGGVGICYYHYYRDFSLPTRYPVLLLLSLLLL